MVKNLVSKFSSELKDPRYFQIFYLGSFLLYGLSFLSWQDQSSYYLIVFGVAIATQLTFTYFTTKRYTSIKSACITALGLCLLLKTNMLWVGGFAAFVAIASKFIIMKNYKHIFNPANIGIIAALFLTSEAWVSPGQWGSSAVFWFFIGAAGLMMILKVGRIDTAFTFLLAFALFQFVYQVLYLGWEPTVWLHKLSNGTLLLFTFFMITDPMTTPNHPKARKIWSVTLAIALFVAGNYFYMQSAAIWLLFLISPFTPLFDKIFIAEKYEWDNQKTPQKQIIIN